MDKALRPMESVWLTTSVSDHLFLDLTAAGQQGLHADVQTQRIE